MIGSLGNVIFNVSSDSVYTFDDLQMTRAANYAEHQIHGSKALLEFVGLALSTISMKIRIDASLGVNPKDALSELRGILERHQAVAFILDGTPQGDNLWVIESLDEAHAVVNNKGATVACEVSVKLKEYVERG